MNIFLSYAKPASVYQRDFIVRIYAELAEHGLTPRTLGVTDYDQEAPLRGVQRLMIECNGLLAIAFRRSYVQKGWMRFRNNLEFEQQAIDGRWFTTAWTHIETAMAYQLSLPILILPEQGIILDGVLRPSAVGVYLPEFNLEQDCEAYFEALAWKENIAVWATQVKTCAASRSSGRLAGAECGT